MALKCGFTNQTHFTKHFRQLIGITPRAYQEHRFTQFDTAILTIGVALKSELETGSIERKRYAELANTFLAAHFLRDSCTRDRFLKAYTGKLPNHKLKQAIEYIEQHLGEKISLETIAQHLDISQCHFCHLFKQSMGVSPYQYVLQQRIEKAKHLLKQQKLTITNVALECGFANQTHFTKHFRKLTGTTPKAYRKQQSHSCQNLPSLMAQLQCC
ncbi:helix-turn-helix domain-containing protein [Tolypothrix bouteillei VB521301]|uniref:Helix-turn-helix domain-containing protein n=1 Tax=Tolypothrix bouteillei VB521301 TaxID=1479485 RepID=A0A8S9TF18_9CYAN|nr:helix-turn-helix domain-containing protein [Tolypothrix bouteillei VB521301]